MLIKHALKRVARAAGFDVRRLPPAAVPVPVPDIPDAELYQPAFSPWRMAEFMSEYARIKPYTLVPDERCYVLATLVAQASRLPGEVWECGVYRGGTAMLLASRAARAGKTLRLFDTFAGMPETDAVRDLHKAGDFQDTSLEAVRSRVPGDHVQFHQGFIPDTFRGLEPSQIAFAHVDVDIYASIQACCDFIYPRLCVGGFMVFDDYGAPSCPGARAAVDEYFAGLVPVPLVLPNEQAIVFKSCA